MPKPKPDYYRRNNCIIDAGNGKVTEYHSCNYAKKKARELQDKGFTVEKLNPKPQVRGRYTI